jgi:hypothetical protein
VPDFVPRRRVLAASAAALPFLLGIAGCRSSDAFTGPDPLAGRPPLGHDVLTLQAVIAAEENLIDLYRTSISGDPGKRTASQTQMLRSLLAQHEQHLVQLKARLVPGGNGGAGSAPVRGGAASPSSPSGGAASSSPRVSTAELRAAERASAADLVQRLVTVPPALAQLFASIAASDATHVTALGG